MTTILLAAILMAPQTDENYAETVARQRCANAVVRLHKADGRRVGCGAVVGDGLILTAKHVVVAGGVYVRKSDRREKLGTVIATDELNDLALLRVAPWPGMAGDALRSDRPFSEGKVRGFIGAAQGPQRLDGRLGFSRIGPKYLVESRRGTITGDSGSPVVDIDGRLVGVITHGSDARHQRLGFATPIGLAPQMRKRIADESGKWAR